MFFEVLPARARSLWRSLSQTSTLRPFYLAGGSGLALHLGHRQSEDLDFFSRRAFRPELLARGLHRIGSPEELSLGEGSAECWLKGFKVQFLHYPYRRLQPLHPSPYGPIADPLDIVLMKIIAISQRGSKRDFVDLACFLRSYPELSLAALLEHLPRKYGKINRAHCLRALIYFADAERDPMPRLRWRLPWKAIKQQLQSCVRELLG